MQLLARGVYANCGVGALSQESYIGGAHELVSLLNGEVIGATSGLKYNDSVANIALQHTDLMLR